MILQTCVLWVEKGINNMLLLSGFSAKLEKEHKYKVKEVKYSSVTPSLN